MSWRLCFYVVSPLTIRQNTFKLSLNSTFNSSPSKFDEESRDAFLKGKNIKEFIDNYIEMPDLYKTISECYNDTRLIEVLKDFIKGIDNIVKNEKAYAKLTKVQKEEVVRYIEEYIFAEIYPQYIFL